MRQATRSHCPICQDMFEDLCQKIADLTQNQHSLSKLNQALIQSLKIQSPQPRLNYKQLYRKEIQRSCRIDREVAEQKIEKDLERNQRERKKQNIKKVQDLVLECKIGGLSKRSNKDITNQKTIKKTLVSSLTGTHQFILKAIR